MNYDIYIDGFIGQSDFFGEGFSAKTLREKLALAPAGVDELTVHINSGGGSVLEGFAIHDALKNTGHKVNTSVEGLCGSIATIVAQSNSKGGKRTMNKNSEYFIHNPYWTPDSPTPMEASDLTALATSLQENETRIAEFYSSVTGKEVSFIKDKMASTTSFTSQEAKDFGFVDEVIGDVKAFQKHLINADGKEYRFAAFVNSNNKNNNMDILKSLNDFENRITALLKPKFKNETTKTSEGVDVYYEGVLAVGSKLFTDESLSVPAPDGVHTIGDKKYLVKDGVVTSEEDFEAAADVSALKAENEKLKAQLAEKETAIANSTTELTAVKAEKAEAIEAAKTVTEEFKNLKAQFVTGTGELKPEFQAFKGDEETKPIVVNKKLNENLAKHLK